jgi:spermidine synthase
MALGIPLRKYHSNYSGNLYITMENGKKVLNTDTVNYSFNSLHRVFQEAFAKSSLVKGANLNTLILGLGAGSIIQILRKEYQMTGNITAVDIDPIIIEIAKSEFNIHQFDPVKLVQADALDFLKTDLDSYHLICMDLFINEEVPMQFLNIEFIKNLLTRLTPHGRLYINIMLVNGQIKKSFHLMYDEIKQGAELNEVQLLQLEENNVVLMVIK